MRIAHLIDKPVHDAVSTGAILKATNGEATRWEVILKNSQLILMDVDLRFKHSCR